MASVGAVRPLTGLLRASHPLPCLAVTAFATAFGVVAVGLGPGTAALLALAVLTGQLSVGWSNDWLDVSRDVVAGRSDKPVPAGLVPRSVVGVAALLGLSACVVASLALGLLPGAVHLVAVASAWAYNARLKATWASPLPYAASFGLLVAVATTSGAPARWPSVGVVVATALLGVGAHFANTVGDTEADRLTGVRGLPQRIGPHTSLLVTAVLVALAALALLLDVRGAGPIGTVLLAGGAAVAGGAALLGRRRSYDRTAFRVTLVSVGLVVGGFLAATATGTA